MDVVPTNTGWPSYMFLAISSATASYLVCPSYKPYRSVFPYIGLFVGITITSSLYILLNPLLLLRIPVIPVTSGTSWNNLQDTVASVWIPVLSSTTSFASIADAILPRKSAGKHPAGNHLTIITSPSFTTYSRSLWKASWLKSGLPNDVLWKILFVQILHSQHFSILPIPLSVRCAVWKFFVYLIISAELKLFTIRQINIFSRFHIGAEIIWGVWPHR